MIYFILPSLVTCSVFLDYLSSLAQVNLRILNVSLFPFLQNLYIMICAHFQTQWKEIKLLILDEKSMVGRSQVGRMDRHLHQAHPQNADEIFGGIPTIFFSDFGQLPPVGDSPMYSDKPSAYHTALHAEGCCVFESFKQSVTLNTVYHQTGQSAEQVTFREALLRLRTYSTTLEDFELFSGRFWDYLTPEQRTEFDDVLHLLPT